MGPISRADLVRNLRALGFEGPFSGGSHEFMRRNRLRVRIPNPHRGDIGRGLLLEILEQAGVTREEWVQLR
ncbi:MAG: type II toxin-antitoxin system HicA family toxin [Chloroflexota bacterium]|nr:type II toxin-antitoxin system HicA family toxin [Chloroflexota bacterium]